MKGVLVGKRIINISNSCNLGIFSKKQQQEIIFEHVSSLLNLNKEGNKLIDDLLKEEVDYRIKKIISETNVSNSKEQQLKASCVYKQLNEVTLPKRYNKNCFGENFIEELETTKKEERMFPINNGLSLIIDRTIDDNYIGELIVLVGANNVGKTNILNSIELLGKTYEYSYNHNTEKINDYKNFNKTNLLPCIFFIYKTGFQKDENNLIAFSFNTVKDINNQENRISFKLNTTKKWLNDNGIDQNIDNSIMIDGLKYKNLPLNDKNLISQVEIQKYLDKRELMQFEDESAWNLLQRIEGNNNKILFPKIFFYDKISQIIDDNYFEINKLEDNKNKKLFWNKLFFIFNRYNKKIKLNFIDFLNDYEIKNKEEILNECCGKLSSQFNYFFGFKENIYEFKIQINFNEKMSFFIKVNNELQKYSKQSVGFQTIFEMLITLQSCIMNDNETILRPGDILLFDEPFTNLETLTIVNIRNWLRKLCNDLKITIIIATHLPALVDFDFLENIRIATNKNNECFLKNNYWEYDGYEGFQNTSKPITQSMKTFTGNVLETENPYFIYVEGITDYLYLTGIKHYILRENSNHYIKNWIFIPIGGLGEVEINGKSETVGDSYTQEIKSHRKEIKNIEKEIKRQQTNITNLNKNKPNYYKNLEKINDLIKKHYEEINKLKLEISEKKKILKQKQKIVREKIKNLQNNNINQRIFILTDGDDSGLKSNVKNTPLICCCNLKQITFGKKKEIEDFISKTDKIKFHLIWDEHGKNNKNPDFCAIFKKAIIKGDCTKKTIKNLESLVNNMNKYFINFIKKYN
ncbi:AAA family ATPase [Ureaplasma ceti]|uniref:ATPase AAA-type core domain-containing protein n=1 Tax=Ureaplasma ceti TaxID=3119530 RepID=A0ABP9U6I9_9BACT